MNPIRTLTAREIECRVSQIKKNGLQLLLYKDARCDMAILDEAFGPMNWQRRHCRDNANCIVSIWDDSKGCWIEKEDTGTESNTEAEKGLASDSFKRACVNIGIGRELYTAPFIWFPATDCNIGGDAKYPKCFDTFEVTALEYEGRKIKSVTIINKTAPRLLALAEAAGARTVMVGPSVVMAPELFNYGVDMLAGSVVRDPEKARFAVQCGAGQFFGTALSMLYLEK